MRVKDLNIGKRLNVGFGLVMAVMVVVLALALIDMRHIERSFDQVIRVNAAKIDTANSVIHAVDAVFYSMAVIIMTKDKDVIKEHEGLLAESRRGSASGLEAIQKLEQTDKGKELIAQCLAQRAQGKVANDKAMDLARAGENEKAMEIYVKEARPYALQIQATMGDLVMHEKEEMQAANQAAMRTSATNRLIIVVFTLAAVGFGIAVTLFLKSSIVVPLSEGVRIADQLAAGQLDVRLSLDRKDEVGKLLASMKNMVDKWRGVVGQITETAARLSSAATELSTSAEQMSKGSAVQAERTTVISSSSEQMSQTVLDVAKNAGNISKSANDTVNTARDGETIVNRAVKEVKEIASTVGDSSRFVQSLGDRSKQIGEIVGVINDIADQTNLLALNAAIEAARAGEQGRGFAVVADEVRKLAERTASSTSEIGTMINSVQNEVGKAMEVMANATSKVDQGVRLSEEAGSALTSIVKSVDGLQAIMQQIASATEEMSATSEEITREIDQIATISRETSSSSEQTAKASGELAALSTTLENIVREFRL